jgi:hypothetical protein
MRAVMLNGEVCQISNTELAKYGLDGDCYNITDGIATAKPQAEVDAIKLDRELDAALSRKVAELQAAMESAEEEYVTVNISGTDYVFYGGKGSAESIKGEKDRVLNNDPAATTVELFGPLFSDQPFSLIEVDQIVLTIANDYSAKVKNLDRKIKAAYVAHSSKDLTVLNNITF